MKKQISIIGAISSTLLLAGCFGTEVDEPLPIVKDEAPVQTSQNLADQKLTLSGEELKIHFEEVQAQRFVALQAFQAFFPAVYKKEIRTMDYKSAIENIVAQYQYVYSSAAQLTNSYPDDADFASYNEVIRLETEQIIVPTLKLYYDMSASELLSFDEKMNGIKPTDVEEFQKQLMFIGERLSTNERVSVIAVKDTMLKYHRDLFSKAAGVNAIDVTESDAVQDILDFDNLFNDEVE